MHVHTCPVFCGPRKPFALLSVDKDVFSTCVFVCLHMFSEVAACGAHGANVDKQPSVQLNIKNRYFYLFYITYSAVY